MHRAGMLVAVVIAFEQAEPNGSKEDEGGNDGASSPRAIRQ